MLIITNFLYTSKLFILNMLFLKGQTNMKRFITFLLAIITAISISMPALSYDAKEHDKYLEKVLFGDEEYSNEQTKSIKKKIKMIENASYLSIDQCRGDGKTQLTFLKKQKVKNLPKLKEFDLNGIFYGKHRNYTHRGWEYSYLIPKGEEHDKANWPVRKDILRSTVNKVFDFGFENERFGNYCKQCDSFSALIYYVHILGDLIEADSYKTKDLTMKLARTDASDSNPDVFWELKKHCEVIFESQEGSMIYNAFFQDLDELAEKSRTLAGAKGGIDNDRKFKKYHRYTNDLMALLTNYVPLLLQKEDFFKNEFYS